MDSSNQINAYINSLGDWRGELLAQLRGLIKKAEPELHEGWKWGVPVWTSNGLVCAISAFKDHVKMNFFKGAYLEDPNGLFNSGLDSKEHRSINFAQADQVNVAAVKELVRAATAFNKG